MQVPEKKFGILIFASKHGLTGQFEIYSELRSSTVPTEGITAPERK